MAKWADKTRGGFHVRNIILGGHLGTLEGEVFACPPGKSEPRWMRGLWYSDGSYLVDYPDNDLNLVHILPLQWNTK